MDKNLAILLTLPAITVPQNVYESNYKISDSKIISVDKLVNAFGNQQMTVRYDNRNYSFTTKDFLDYFMSKPIANVVGQEDYNSFLSQKPSNLENCKCNQIYKWIDGRDTTMDVNAFGIKPLNKIFNSALNKMFNGFLVSYNSSEIKELPEDTNKLILNFDNKGYKLLLTLADFLSPETIRKDRNSKTCYILTDVYEWLLLNRFINKEMGNFLETFPKPKRSK